MSTPSNCPMCLKAALGRKWSELIIKGTKSSVDAADVFKMSIEDVEKHVYKHQQPVVMVQTSRDKEYFIEKLNTIHDQLDEVLDVTMLNTELSVKNVTSLTKEIRETLKLIAEVSGVIGGDNSAAMQKNLVEMQRQYAELTGMVLECCCQECQQKIVAKMKGQKEITDGSQD